MPKTGLHLALIFAVTAVVFFTNLGGPKLWDDDEPRNAGCTREMLERGDWVTPYFNGELRTHKPILTYWLMMGSYALFGDNEFGARFPSAALGIVTVLASLVIARRLFSREAGLWTALVLGTSLLFCVVSRAATPDAGLICASTLAIMIYVVGTFCRKTEVEERSAAPLQLRVANRYFPTWPVAAVMYACMSLGVLAKGPVGLILPTAVIGMFLLIMTLPAAAKANPRREAPDQNWTFLHWSLFAAALLMVLVFDATIGPPLTFVIVAIALVGYGWWKPRSLAAQCIRPLAPRHFLATCWQMRPLTAIAVVLLVAGPWYLFVGLRTDGVWLKEFFLTHNFARATQVFEGHRGTYLFYPASLWVGLFPWSILLIPAVAGTVARIRRREAWRMGYIFALCWIGVYIGAFSLARTKLPNYIAPAYPAVAMLLGAFVLRWSRGEVTSRMWQRFSFSLLALFGIGMAIGLPIAAHLFAPGDEWLGVLGLLPLATAGICYALHRRKLLHLAACSLAGFAVLFMTVSMGVVAPHVSRHQQIGSLLQTVRQSSDRPRLATYRAHKPSWVFYWGEPLPAIGRRNADELRTYCGDRDAFLLTTHEALPELQPLLPADVVPLARARCFLRDYDLILLGRSVRLTAKDDKVTR